MILLAMLACQAPTDEAPPGAGAPDGAAELGAEAPDVTLIGADGDTFALSDDRGSVIFLDMSGFH